MKKDERKKVYDKFQGHCAYCGCEVLLSKFEVDHMVPIMRGVAKGDLIKYGYNHIKGNDDFSNLMPACKPCNRQKKTYSVETWRKVLKGKVRELNRDSSVYRTAKRFGLIEEIDIDIKFYFEKIEMSADTFRDIQGYESIYAININGDIKNTKTGNILKRHKMKNGYYRVTLYCDGIDKHHLVHRLVAKTFTSNKENLPQINHIDGNKHNNNVKNLEWTTSSDNLKHAHKLGLKSTTKYWTGKIGKQNCNSKKVVQYGLDGNKIKVRYSMADVEGELGIYRDGVSGCCSNPNRHKTAGGYKRKYF